MPDVNPLAIAAATVAAFLITSTYYTIFATKLATLRGVAVTAPPEQPPPGKIAAELLRSLAVATVLAAVISRGHLDTPAGIALLSLGAWVAFPVTLLAGSVLWENVRPGLALLHAGDWLVKLAAIVAIISALQ